MGNLLLNTFEVGRTRGRGDGVFYFEVTKPLHLEERVFPFFERFRLRGPKAKDLSIFKVRSPSSSDQVVIFLPTASKRSSS